MNLLIAMMASTYQKALENSKVQRLQDRYRIVHDASYICSSGAIKWGGKGRGKGREREKGRKQYSAGTWFIAFKISKYPGSAILGRVMYGVTTPVPRR